MPQQPIELILIRQWASYMAIPVWLMDATGNLLYYNEPAEEALGRTLDLAGPIHAREIARMFATTRPDGSPFPNDELPVVRALAEGHPAHAPVRYQGLDGTIRQVEVTAFPVERPGGEVLGVVAMFWEARPG